MRRSLVVLCTALAAVGLSFMLVGPVAAKPPVRSEGYLAAAIGSTSLETDATLVFMGIEIYTDGVYAQAQVSRATYALGGDEPVLLAEEYGTVNLTASDVIVADDLSALVLRPVAADLWDCGDSGCTPTETVMVAATFTANAPMTTTVERAWDRSSKDCRSRSTTTYDDVVATMSLDFDGVVTVWDEAGAWRQTWETRTWGCEG